jgi:hypothetical protein
VPNPQINLGSLNRLRASVTWPAFSNLNVTAPFLGKEGVRITFNGDAVKYLPTMTGAVTSPEPYQEISMIITLLKTQALANAYKNQLEQNALIGDGSVRPDSTALAIYQFINCAIQGVEQLDFSGESPVWAVKIGGYYATNQALYG